MSRQDLTPADEPASPLLALDPSALQLVWDSCTFGAKAALACTCRKLQHCSQTWYWGRLPSHRWQEVAFHWWLKHRKLSRWNEFVVQTNGSMGRVGDYEAAEEVQAAWGPTEQKVVCGPLPGVRPDGHPPLQWVEPGDIGYDPVTRKAALFPDKDAWPTLGSATYMPMSRVISSPMLLYRLRCLFPSCEVEQSDGYQGVWHISLRHKRTGCRAAFGEHGGAVTVCGDTAFEGDKATTQDLLDLIELLCSDRCPHTYDGLVAGCVA